MEGAIAATEQMKHKLPKTLTLDVSKWRCGDCGDNKCRLGKGSTMLLNRQGCMCCLGQFSLQSGLEKKYLKHQYEPSECNKTVTSLVSREGYCSKLSMDCMDINDDETTTIKEKIKLLRKRLAKSGRKLIVKNLQKTLKKDC